ncbi:MULTISPECIES: twin-arginine translocation signal domain-containing protein [Sulfurospirillum]|uniref:Formate dehydrogenase accessory protein FdhE n=3 Tax=Sulfurospirillum TaxID=57665 RepID=A0A1D7TN40_9BACT|nr:MULTISPECIES: twin-arginine translocation signal domain-containing protein [Sulfurospirillum]AAR28533.1 formate dehydrogenase subunit E [Sulfurospirillum multivorans DSM 12446]AHJ14111.1 formate dehydrogenase accessory protein FdhE [Sulfurospirillum multivorans DSM 12446]AOO66416.1 formate dehydrogenase accessory protein FdhE [Sulfurospirillum halorespirans DSM 13726]QEH07598.1 formate dehydrogenase accessory protein FdhE [Sulfurospirillum multivorans]
MNESRRGFVAKAALVGAVAAVGVVGAQASSSGTKGSNGVVVGKSNKKEITYKKTQAWEDYYKSAL